jgi:choline dehydrogenase
VFLIEAGGDHGAELEQVVPAQTFTAEEDAKMAWTFYINHYRNQTQGRRDSKYVYRLTDGTLYYGLEPPSRAKPLGTLYPRGATLGGSTQINALNWGAPSDNDVGIL